MMDIQKFYRGEEFRAWTYLGANPLKGGGFIFRTYAPAAKAVSVIGEFNGWTDTPMKKIQDGNFWEAEVPEAKSGQMYKIRVYNVDGKQVDHADPYAVSSELRPGTASVLWDMNEYIFSDEYYLAERSDRRDRPLNIYELHLGSWKTKKNVPDGEDPKEGWYNYREIAQLLIPYVKEYGYNAIEVMPLAEYPADESWGYQGTGFFSATARYGTPDDLKAFVDQMHKAGIAVLLDVVTVHYAVNDYGLWRFDGTALYEYPHKDVGISEWGSVNFIHSRPDVRSFLQSSCNFWLEEYHFDGLRYDAVSNLIYWQGDYNRGENKDAAVFLRNMNSGIKTLHPDVLLIAEDSTMYEKTTWMAGSGGLNFDYKWDLGWMNDTLAYLKTGFDRRSQVYDKLIQSMNYYHKAYYLLPLSHDEVVHGKGTIVEKIWGDFDQRIAQVKTLYLYMVAHPGKKLNFMGNELAMTREWTEKRQPDWASIKDPLHRSVAEFVKELNHMYLEHPALWERDYESGGFDWIENRRAQDNVIAFIRASEEETLVCLFNFSDRKQGIRLPENLIGAGSKEQIAQILLSSGKEHAHLAGSDVTLEALSGTVIRVR